MTRPESEYPGDLRPLRHDIAELKRRRAQSLAGLRARLRRVRSDIAQTLSAFQEERDQRQRDIESARDALAGRLASARSQLKSTVASLRAGFAAARVQSRLRTNKALAEATNQMRAEVSALRNKVATAKALRFRTGSFGEPAVRRSVAPARPRAPATKPASPATRKSRRNEGRNFLDSISY